jgi:hypothetical protein
MRRRWALLLALALGGCFTARPEQDLTRHDARLPFAAPDEDGLVVLEIAQLECGVNDPYVGGPLWDFVDESDNAARRAALHGNGFRPGTLGPSLPEHVLDLAVSERNAANFREWRVLEGQPAAVPIGPSWAHCRYELWRDGEPAAVELDQAQCVVEVVPGPAAKDGRRTLTFTPLVRHGGPQVRPRPVRDSSGVLRWELESDPLIERYPWLGWELTLAPNEYAVVGAQAGPADTLGRRTFLHTEGVTPVQRLLVLRVVPRPAAWKAEEHGNGPPPLALQAGWGAVRSANPEK